MRPSAILAAVVMAVAVLSAPALAQKSGGVLRIYHRDSPASMSVHEEASNSVSIPMMAVFNNLAIYDQHIAQNSLDTIRPDLADSWSWSEDGKRLTFRLRKGVNWHDGKPFSAADVKCTFDLLTGKAKDKLRANPRKSWWSNLEDVTTSGDYEATFVLSRPQPALLTLLASGMTPIYPCHVPPAQMRQHPIGTGPFKFVEFKPNESIKLAKNPDYWKPGWPYLDGVEYTIVPNRATAILAFIAGKFDMTFPYEVSVPMIKDVKAQAPSAICDLVPGNSSTNLLINRDKPPFDNADIRRALMLALDRKTFIDILGEGQGDIGGAMLPPPAGLWGMSPEMLATLPGYGADINANRAEARKIMEKLGYSSEKRLAIRVSTRNIPTYRDAAVILNDQLKSIYIDGDLDVAETATWFPKIARHDYQIGVGNTGSSVDDPDQQFFENYACGSERNYTGYCNRELETLFVKQSVENDQQKRRALVSDIDRKLQEDAARPIIYHFRAGTCYQRALKGATTMVNSQYNGWRMEDWWLDR